MAPATTHASDDVTKLKAFWPTWMAMFSGLKMPWKKKREMIRSRILFGTATSSITNFRLPIVDDHEHFSNMMLGFNILMQSLLIGHSGGHF